MMLVLWSEKKPDPVHNTRSRRSFNVTLVKSNKTEMQYTSAHTVHEMSHENGGEGDRRMELKTRGDNVRDTFRAVTQFFH